MASNEQLPSVSNLSSFVGKAQVTGDLGDFFAKQLEEAIKTAARKEGASAGVRAANKKAMASLSEHLKAAELDKVTEQQIGMYLERFSTCLESFAGQVECESLVANGMVASLMKTRDTIQKHHQVAVSRAQQIEAALTATEPEHEEKGGRGTLPPPGGGKFAQRSKKKKVAKRAPRKKRAN